jgi:hypothetical protein
MRKAADILLEEAAVVVVVASPAVELAHELGQVALVASAESRRDCRMEHCWSEEETVNTGLKG